MTEYKKDQSEQEKKERGGERVRDRFTMTSCTQSFMASSPCGCPRQLGYSCEWRVAARQAAWASASVMPLGVGNDALAPGDARIHTHDSEGGEGRHLPERPAHSRPARGSRAGVPGSSGTAVRPGRPLCRRRGPPPL